MDELARLHAQYTDLLRLPDALDDLSETAGQMRVLSLEMARYERIGAEDLRQRHEAQLKMPLGHGAALQKAVSAALREASVRRPR